jgi:hypothetical protein
MKRCSQCSAEKPESDFYPRSAKCKTCYRAKVKARRLANLETVRAYDRERALLPHRIQNAMRVTREWRRRHRDRQAAHNKANRTAGMVAPERCEGCGHQKRLEKHHPDYSKPLLVVWLCKPCHAIADKIRRRLEAS